MSWPYCIAVFTTAVSLGGWLAEAQDGSTDLSKSLFVVMLLSIGVQPWLI